MARWKWLVALTVLFVSAPSFAEGDNTGYCKDVSMLAKNIMTGRQSGSPMSELMGTAEKIPAPFDNLSKQIVVDAYESSRFDAESSRARAVSEFENKWYMLCYKTMSKSK